MSTILESLTLEDREPAHGICLGTYLEGECYAFAIALHRAFGWSMVGLMQGKVIRHALVRQPDGIYRDARGEVEQAEIGEPFGVREPYVFRVVSESDLKSVRPVYEHVIATATTLGEIVWPDLPWNGMAKKAVAFADELEALSRKHGIWIRAAVPAARPVLSEQFGEEAGYTVSPSVNGGGFFLERRLE